MGLGAVTTWGRRFVGASAVFLVAWQLLALVGGRWTLLEVVPRQTEVSLAVYGFVLHAVFGKAYSLVPSYFDRSLALPRSPAVHFPLTALGAVGLTAAPLSAIPEIVGLLGRSRWRARTCERAGPRRSGERARGSRPVRHPASRLFAQR